jgi:hypothetical protein
VRYGDVPTYNQDEICKTRPKDRKNPVQVSKSKYSGSIHNIQRGFDLRHPGVDKSRCEKSGFHSKPRKKIGRTVAHDSLTGFMSVLEQTVSLRRYATVLVTKKRRRETR